MKKFYVLYITLTAFLSQAAEINYPKFIEKNQDTESFITKDALYDFFGKVEDTRGKVFISLYKKYPKSSYVEKAENSYKETLHQLSLTEKRLEIERFFTAAFVMTEDHYVRTCAIKYLALAGKLQKENHQALQRRLQKGDISIKNLDGLFMMKDQYIPMLTLGVDNLKILFNHYKKNPPRSPYKIYLCGQEYINSSREQVDRKSAMKFLLEDFKKDLFSVEPKLNMLRSKATVISEIGEYNSDSFMVQHMATFLLGLIDEFPKDFSYELKAVAMRPFVSMATSNKVNLEMAHRVSRKMRLIDDVNVQASLLRAMYWYKNGFNNLAFACEHLPNSELRSRARGYVIQFLAAEGSPKSISSMISTLELSKSLSLKNRKYLQKVIIEVGKISEEDPNSMSDVEREKLIDDWWTKNKENKAYYLK